MLLVTQLISLLVLILILLVVMFLVLFITIPLNAVLTCHGCLTHWAALTLGMQALDATARDTYDGELGS